MGSFLSCNFNVYISSISKYLEFTIFSGSTFYSGEVFLNWLNKRARLGGGVKWIKQLLLEMFSDTFLLYNEIDKNSLLHKSPKGKIVLQQ